MPYIKQEQRKVFKPILKNLRHKWRNASPGQLAYLLWNLLIIYQEMCEETYSHYAEMLGVLESVKLEFYNRFIQPYEQKKRQENSDVSIKDLF